MKNTKPETAGTTIIGSRKNRVSTPRPGNCLRKSIASPKPIMNSIPTATTMKRTVRHIAAQKVPSFSASQYPSNQYQ